MATSFDSLSTTQQYFALIGVELIRKTADHDVILEHQSFDPKHIFEIAPYLSGPFNKLSELGQRNFVQSLMDNKIVYSMGYNLYRFRPNVINHLLSECQNANFIVKEKHKNQFSFQKYKINTDKEYEYRRICFEGSDECGSDLWLLSFELHNGQSQLCFQIKTNAFNQNSTNDTGYNTERACGPLAIIVALPYMKQSAKADQIMGKITNLLCDSKRIPCTIHDNCTRIEESGALLSLLQKLDTILADCADEKYIKKMLKKCEKYLQRYHFNEHWDMNNSLAQVSAEMLESLREHFTPSGAIDIVNNPSQCKTSIEEGVLHQEYGIIQRIVGKLSDWSSTDPITFQTAVNARVSDHFKTILVRETETIEEYDDAKQDVDNQLQIPHFCSVFDLDTLKDHTSDCDIYVTLELICNAPYLNLNIVAMLELVMETELTLFKLIENEPDYNMRMAWEIREILVQTHSQWPRFAEERLHLGYSCAEVRAYFIDEMNRLNIDTDPKNVRFNNWGEYILNIGMDAGLYNKVFEIANRSQWVALKRIVKRLKAMKIEILMSESTDDTDVDIVNKTVSIKNELLNKYKTLAKDVKSDCPQTKLREYLTEFQATKENLIASLYESEIVNDFDFDSDSENDF